MPRTALTKTVNPGGYSVTGRILTMAAADATNKNSFTASNRDVVFAHNTGGSSATVTINSTPDNLGRLGDVNAQTLLAGEYRVFGPLSKHGWVQSDGATVHLEASSTAVKFGVLSL